jgi:hypothetical protein
VLESMMTCVLSACSFCFSVIDIRFGRLITD